MAQKGCLEYLQENGGSSASEVAEENKIAITSVKRNMEALRQKGLVKEDESTKPHIYELTEQGKEENPADHGGMVV